MKKRIHHLLRLTGILAAVVGGIVLLGFVEHSTGERPISDIKVRVHGTEGVHFIDEATIERAVLDQGNAVLGAPLGQVDLPSIEDRLRAIPAVAAAEVYHTMDGILHVKVRQREPVVRVFTRDGESFYIDKEGWTMPVSEVWTARVPVVSGQLSEIGVRDGVRAVALDGATDERVLSDDIHRLALFIRAHPLWNAMVDQITVDAAGVFELVPKVGAQRIVLGTAAQWPNEQALADRFTKLEHFYREGIPRSDWRRYARIDLRFAGQIVCTQRTTP